jgi:hypothetical protein
VSIRLFIWHAENVYALNMLLLLRRLKYDLFMNQSFRRYAAYAFGELLLVVVGILIALQIDNWNDDRKERATLQSYLHSIARNMREDLTELEPLRQHRRAARQAGLFFTYLLDKDNYTIDEIFFLNQVRVLSTREVFFNANTSSFEALKISGVLDRLQGSNIEHLLSSYYDTVNQISQLESSLYDLVRPISIELGRERVDHLEPFAIANPMALPPSRFQELQPTFSRPAITCYCCITIAFRCWANRSLKPSKQGKWTRANCCPAHPSATGMRIWDCQEL